MTSTARRAVYCSHRSTAVRRVWTHALKPVDFVRRIQLWLAKAARGELHDTAQPPDPLFFVSQLTMIVPRAALLPADNPVELIGFVRPEKRADADGVGHRGCRQKQQGAGCRVCREPSFQLGSCPVRR
jgi:hypothetical protein